MFWYHEDSIVTHCFHAHEDTIVIPWGNVCPARYLCIKYPVCSPRFILTQGSPPSRLH